MAKKINKTKEERTAYARECWHLSKKYALPFTVALVFGTDEEKYILAKDVRLDEMREHKGLCYELSCGINRRKEAIEWALGEEFSKKINLSQMGQKNSKRLAEWLIGGKILVNGYYERKAGN